MSATHLIRFEADGSYELLDPALTPHVVAGTTWHTGSQSVNNKCISDNYNGDCISINNICGSDVGCGEIDIL